jgi:hypothetical protein
MADWRQIGTCNWCGDCCHEPFAKNWPEAVLAWPYSALQAQFPMAPIIGLGPQPNGKVGFVGGNRYGSTKITGSPASGAGTYYWVWVQGVGFCTDTSAGHDGTSYETKCPYLRGASSPYEGCALNMNSRHRFRYTDGFCGQRDQQLIFTDEGKVDWDANNPNCVLTWEEVV